MKRAERVSGLQIFRKAPRTRQGFTLLEVLAAVAILGIWYIVIASLAIQGLRAEGKSQRLLEASLIADEVVADLEAAIAGGALPPLEATEEERDVFMILTEVEPFDIPMPQTEGQPIPPTGPPSAFSHLTGSAEAPPLRKITVEVTWTEGAQPLSVLRETFALDLTASMSSLQEAESAIQGTRTDTSDSEEEDEFL